MTTELLEMPQTIDAGLSLYNMLDPEVLADPYPLYARLRAEDPVHWDPFLHAWVVTRYDDVVNVLHRFSSDRAPAPEVIAAMDSPELSRVADVMRRQMIFLDPPAHTRLRNLATPAFSPARVRDMRGQIQQVADDLLDALSGRDEFDLVADLAGPLPAIVTARMLGVPEQDHVMLREWSFTFSEMLGNFQANPDGAERVAAAVEGLTAYFRDVIREHARSPREGLVHAFLTAECDGDRFSEDEVIANCILTLVAGLETSTNLIATGMLHLSRHPDQYALLRANPDLLPSAIEELLRFDTPSHYTARVASHDTELGGKRISRRQAVIAVMAAANRDPEKFPRPDRLDITRSGTKHISFGWGAHYCFGAPLARMEGQIAMEGLLKRFDPLTVNESAGLVWRDNLGLRGLVSLPVRAGANRRYSQ